MSGFRANCGYGKLNRTEGAAEMTALPWADGTKTATKKIFDKGITTPGYDEGDCIHQLIHRFGVGIDLSINRNRNNNYLQDLGQREITAATTGMYDIDFTINGAFAPECSDWLEYAMMSEPVTIAKDSTFSSIPGSSPSVGYVSGSKTPILESDFNTYMAMVTSQDEGKVLGDKNTLVVKVYSYLNLDGPKYFDLGYTQINKNTANGGLNEIGILTGCVIDSISISYESGSDAAVKFTINGIALKEYIATTSQPFDYNAILDNISQDILVTGCLSVEDGSSFVPVAQTDSASVTISNNVSKLGNCLELNYSSVALGALGIELSTSTYSNDPNKYLSYMYGIYGGFEETDRDPNAGDTQYTIRKKLTPIDRMKIRSAGDEKTTYITGEAQTEPRKYTDLFMDINLTKVYVGSSNRSYSVDSAIMDEPDLRPSKVQLAVGHLVEVKE